jgi:hypothetical protein
MSKSAAIASFVVVLLVAVTAVAATSPVVPPSVRAQIERQAPGLAYAPTRMARSFRYTSWRRTRRTVQIAFDNKAGWEIRFVVTAQRGSCEAGKEKSFQLDGNKVYWSHTGAEQQAWRCVADLRGREVRLVASSPQPPTLFAAVGLGRVVASAARIT